MTAALNKIALFKWRAASYFFAPFFLAGVSAWTTSNTGTTTVQWVIALCAMSAAGWGGLKGFLDTAAQEQAADKHDKTQEITTP